MNKRKAKKYKKKVICPIRDEFGLIGMTKEELDAEYQAYHTYVQKYCHYKHYKDKKVLMQKYGYYCCGFASGNSSFGKSFEKELKTMRKYNVTQHIVVQSLDELKQMYPDKCKEIKHEM